MIFCGDFIAIGGVSFGRGAMTRLYRLSGAVIALVLMSGCSTNSGQTAGMHVSAALSPVPIATNMRTAWKQAEVFASLHPDTEVLVGQGGSMLPLYPDRTILIVERQPAERWRSGMSVAFRGRGGYDIVHVLVKQTKDGWVTAGLANSRADTSLVSERNYIGTVIRAYAEHAALVAVQDA